MRERGAQHAAPGQELFTVRETLFRLAEDIGLAYKTVESARWTASRWPKEHRQAGVSFRVHRILGQIENEAERLATIAKPPAGGTRWTVDEANRRVGRQVERPASPQEKITAIHSPARDEAVAATVATSLLRRADVTLGRMSDDTARFRLVPRMHSVMPPVTVHLAVPLGPVPEHERIGHEITDLPYLAPPQSALWVTGPPQRRDCHAGSAHRRRGRRR